LDTLSRKSTSRRSWGVVPTVQWLVTISHTLGGRGSGECVGSRSTDQRETKVNRRIEGRLFVRTDGGDCPYCKRERVGLVLEGYRDNRRSRAYLILLGRQRMLKIMFASYEQVRGKTFKQIYLVRKKEPLYGIDGSKGGA